MGERGLGIREVAAGRVADQNSAKRGCTENFDCYIPRPLSGGGAGHLTINRQLFFVWLDNAFAFD